jgi:hypothetical protein
MAFWKYKTSVVDERGFGMEMRDIVVCRRLKWKTISVKENIVENAELFEGFGVSESNP